MGLMIDQLIQSIFAFKFDGDIKGLRLDYNIFGFWANMNIFWVGDKQYLKIPTFFR